MILELYLTAQSTIKWTEKSSRICFLKTSHERNNNPQACNPQRLKQSRQPMPYIFYYVPIMDYYNWTVCQLMNFQHPDSASTDMAFVGYNHLLQAFYPIVRKVTGLLFIQQYWYCWVYFNLHSILTFLCKLFIFFFSKKQGQILNNIIARVSRK